MSPLSRMEAWLLLTRYVKNKNLRKHCLACEATLEDLAPRFDADPARWGLAGLLHDLDVELTQDNPERHALVTAEMLATEGFDGPLTLHCEFEVPEADFLASVKQDADFFRAALNRALAQ